MRRCLLCVDSRHLHLTRSHSLCFHPRHALHVNPTAVEFSRAAAAPSPHPLHASQVPVATEAEALNLLYAGELLRTTAQHNLNRCSNRSHCILTLHLTQRARSGVSEKVVTSKLNLVDLAGSERLKKALDLERLEGRSLGDATIKKESM
jgi:Kinesin motor domain